MLSRPTTACSQRLNAGWSASLLAAGLLWAALVLAGCGGGGGTENGGVQIERGDRSPAFEGAQARFASPADSSVVDSNAVSVVVDVDNYELGVQTETERRRQLANSANGQHVHIIVDNGPYMANYEAGSPFAVGSLATGPHSAVVFPSRSYHESVKGADAYDIVNFYVGEETGEFPLDPSQPTIIYSRPKGSYSGAGAERIMMDFYLHNVELSENGHRARYTIREQDGQEPLASITLAEWTPAFVTGLESGTYVVRLQLIDGDGNVVPGTFNDTERRIQVQAPGA
jgi:hypothetical protein